MRAFYNKIPTTGAFQNFLVAAYVRAEYASVQHFLSVGQATSRMQKFFASMWHVRVLLWHTNAHSSALRVLN